MFVRTDLPSAGESTYRWMPFSQGLVHVGGEPAPVAEGFVRALRARLDDIWDAGGLRSEGLQKGDRVVLKAGVFGGYEAIFDARLPGKERVRLLIRMMGDRFVPVEVHNGLLEKEDR